MSISNLTIKNSSGMQVSLSNYGARVLSILYPVNSKLTEMTVAPDPIINDPFYLGATCGPVCNRISGAGFSLQGKHFKLSKNDGDNCLHSGDENISYQFWEVKDSSDNSVTFALNIPHLADGFPGNRDLSICYILTEDNGLKINFEAQTDTATPINLTNHTYFNLGETDIFDLQCQLSSDKLLERSGDGIPTGNYSALIATGYDLASWVGVGALIHENQMTQIKEEKGIDHCCVLKGDLDKPKAKLRSLKNGVELNVYTDQPAIQFYTGKFLDGPYKAYQGLCFESQGFTDAVNQPNFPSVILEVNEIYEHELTYQFNDL